VRRRRISFSGRSTVEDADEHVWSETTARQQAMGTVWEFQRDSVYQDLRRIRKGWGSKHKILPANRKRWDASWLTPRLVEPVG
jgi:hypothetical protein